MSLTPMLKQYQSIRANLPGDTVLFFRLGDFYEMFFEDAKRASPLLDITLTARDGGNKTRIPMCGVPFHAAQGYINRLTRSGLKVAVCEQVEDPKVAKGIVRREVVRIITPATNLEEDTGEPGQCTYIAAVHRSGGIWGCACIDLGTGEFRTAEFTDTAALEDELLRLSPRECVLSEKLELSALKMFLRQQQPVLNEYEDWVFDTDDARRRILEQFKTVSLASFGIQDLTAGISCAGALLYYLKDNLHKSLDHLKQPLVQKHATHMLLDKQTAANLELLRPAAGDRGTPTLYSILNRTVTPMGARLLGQWLVRPLIDAGQIRQRVDAVEGLTAAAEALGSIREQLGPIRDMERLLARINCGTPSARDIVGLGASLKAVPGLRQAAAALGGTLIRQQYENLCELRDLAATIDQALVELPPPGIRDGGFIRRGYNAELDDLRSISTDAKEWIVELQRREVEKTGIKSLKIRYNKVFGYYIEVTRANLSMVPDHYTRKQTLVNSERFIIPELKDYEEKILGAEERARELEARIFEDLRILVLEHIRDIQRTANAVAVLDVIASYAACALANNYCKPEISEGQTIYIAGGRHPVVEHTLDEEQFVDNDVLLDTGDNQLLIITGPNMAGKSTYIRQVALTVLMAQAGSFVPARIARLGVVDRVFSRIGASDNLARGESTFMVEMIETANILHNATPRSLLVFDEIGRGTSTFDGVSIAWSVCEYLNRDSFRPKCLFATHYHELTQLSDHRRGIKNYNITIKEIGDKILFLRKLAPGGADKSYGIHVGKLAGLPATIIDRAEEILLCLEEEKISEESISQILQKKRVTASVYDLPLFKPLKQAPADVRASTGPVQAAAEEHPVFQEIQGCDVNNLTPLEALTKIAGWKEALQASAPEAKNTASGNRDQGILKL